MKREASVAALLNDIKADYSAAKTGRYRPRLDGVSLSGSSADYHYRSDLEYLRMVEWARKIDRDNMVVGQGITRAINNIVQGGIRVQPATGDDEADRVVAEEWNAWAEDPEQCDKAGENTLTGLLKLGLRAMIVDGDHILLPTSDGSVQSVEAHRVRRPSNTKRNVVHGVLLDEYRKRLEYWITKEDLSPSSVLSKVSDIVAYPVRDADGFRQVCHLYNPRRTSQTRGVTALAPVVDPVNYHDDIQFAKLVQQQVASCFAILESTDVNGTMGQTGQVGSESTDTLADGSSRTIQNIAPGMHYKGQPGSHLSGFSPNIPNPTFFEHAKLILSIISINLDLPLALFLLDATDTNFSSQRWVTDQAKHGWREVQRIIGVQAVRPLYLWKLRQFIEENDAIHKLAGKFGPSLFRHTICPPNWPYIQPLDDAQADHIRKTSLLTSPRRLMAERGQDYEEIVNETVSDNGRAIRAAIEESQTIKAETGVEVDWHELISLTSIKPLTGTIRSSAEPTPEPKGKPNETE